MPDHILIVSSDPDLLPRVREFLHESALLWGAASVEEAAEFLKNRDVAVVAAHISEPGAVRRLIECVGERSLVALASEEARALEALEAGALEALIWPAQAPRLKFALHRALRHARLADRIARLDLNRQPAAPVAWGSSPVIRTLLDRAERLASHDATVLIQGETGAGKTALARHIHARSPRAQEAFVLLDAKDASAPNLAAALRAADGGTLCLRGVESLAPPEQKLLLAAIKDGSVKLEGKPQRADTRVISTSSDKLREQVHRGHFQEDLYWALAGVVLELPPLRERGGDAEELFLHFLDRACRRLDRKPPAVPAGIRSLIRAHPFPGNVLELQALANLCASLCEGSELLHTHLPAQMLAPVVPTRTYADGSLALKPAVRQFERQYLLQVLKAMAGNQSRAARALGIHRNTLILKMQEMGIPGRRDRAKGKKRFSS